MAFDYTELRETANELIEEFGRTENLIRTVTGGDPWDPTQNETPIPVTLVEVDYAEISDRSTTLVEVGDRTGLIWAEATPQKSDKITLSGQRYGFVELMPLQPGDTVLLWKFIARA